MSGKPGPPWISGSTAGRDPRWPGSPENDDESGEVYDDDHDPDRVRRKILEIHSRFETPKTDLQIAEHIPELSRSQVRSLLQGPLKGRVICERGTPIRWRAIEQSDDHRKGEADGKSGDDDTSRVRRKILELDDQSEAPHGNLEISKYIPEVNRLQVSSLLQASSGDPAATEEAGRRRGHPPVKSENHQREVDDRDSMKIWDRVVLDVLRNSPYRLSPDEIAATINSETELETDGTAVEALLMGPLSDRVEQVGKSPTRWSARDS